MPDVPEIRAVTGGAATSITQRLGIALSWTFFGFVTLCILVPLVQTFYPVFGAIVPEVEERRAASPFPSARLLLQTNGDYAAGLNKWFDDRVGFRDLFIRSKNQIDYTLFRTSRKVYVGRDGWLFDRNNLDGLAHLDPAKLATLEDAFVTLARRLRNRGVRLIVVGYPDKSAIYPEMAPAHLPLERTKANYDKLRRFLATRADLSFIDAEDILKREKSVTSENLYARQDVHVTEFGQVPVVKAIISRIAQAEGRPEIRWDEKFILVHESMGVGSEARFMSVLLPATEEVPNFKGKYLIGGKESDGHWFLPDPNVIVRADDGIGRPFDWEFDSLPGLCPARLPGMLLFGNSFSDRYWELGLHRYFCFIRRARDPFSRFNAFYDTMPKDTKYFVFQYYAPWLAAMLSNPWFLDAAPAK